MDVLNLDVLKDGLGLFIDKNIERLIENKKNLVKMVGIATKEAIIKKYLIENYNSILRRHRKEIKEIKEALYNKHLEGINGYLRRLDILRNEIGIYQG